MLKLSFLAALFVAYMGLTQSRAIHVQHPLQSDLRTFDVSRAQAGLNPNFWTCAFNAGYQKVVIRAYQQACGRGGQVDPNFVPAYNAAVSAGFTNIDAYIFPCKSGPSMRCLYTSN